MGVESCRDQNELGFVALDRGAPVGFYGVAKLSAPGPCGQLSVWTAVGSAKLDSNQARMPG